MKLCMRNAGSCLREYVGGVTSATHHHVLTDGTSQMIVESLSLPIWLLPHNPTATLSHHHAVD